MIAIKLANPIQSSSILITPKAQKKNRGCLTFSGGAEVKSFLTIWSHLLKKSLVENFIFCAVNATN